MDLPERLPAALSKRLASASSALYAPQGREYDVAVGGIPFLLATYPDVPQSIETIPVRKDQFDTENDPGEQSLSGWWRRSQSSFHEGAGNLYQESSEENAAHNGFFDSSGVDVFTPGRLTLLKAMRQSGQVAGTQLGRIKTYAINSVRTNLSTNPSYEVDASGNTATHGGNAPDLPTHARSTVRFHSGTASGLVTWVSDDATGNPPGLQLAHSSIAAGTRYTASAWVWVPTGSPAVGIVSDGVLGTNSGSLKDQWVRISVTATAGGTGTNKPQIWPVTPVSAGQSFNVDDILVEESNVVGSYFDGSFPNCAWTGTAHLSTSTETVSSSTVSLSAVGSGSLHTAATVGGTFAALHSPAGKTIVDGVVSGATFYDVASDGTLYQGLLSSPGTATTWPCGATPSRLAWGKHRLWMIGGRRLWQPDVTSAGGTAQNPIFTHPNQGWTYTCLAEGASAMYFGGHDGFTSTIQAVTLDASGGVPSLSGASVTAVLPEGELVQEIAVLAGQFIGIGTTRGFRVGQVSTNGTLTYGPLLIEPSGVSACTAISTQGKFFVVAFRATGENALAYRVDTSNELADGVFPYARDIDCNFIGSVSSLAAPSSTQMVATTSDGQSWYQSTTEYVSSGWLQTGRVRYRTTEEKVFKYLNLEIEPLNGAISVSMIKEGGSTLPLGSVTIPAEIAVDPLGIQVEPMRYAALRFTMTPAADLLSAPVLNSYLLRALPAVTPQRLITLPLLCFDSEQTRSGQKYGSDDWARSRLDALLVLEDMSDTVVFQDFNSVSTGGRNVVIESVKFVQSAPPHKTSQGGAGGIIVLQLRTVEA